MSDRCSGCACCVRAAQWKSRALYEHERKREVEKTLQELEKAIRDRMFSHAIPRLP